jgi:hypothetical protein
MKLYTEDQVRDALRLCELSVCGSIPILSEDDIIQELPPIKLPSDDEIDSIAPSSGIALTSNAFKLGAKWMRDKIGGNNEQQ